ncbi:30S ribosomal protein S12 methylthiotransferase RimO [Azotosporobacter soli]|uniref:30S ribosomal protein S12 methylthiotransferase RimO n=1 Tax=Azotosporobacter soli TaxID=3055040 RepID=UPI0031FE6D46
MLKAGFISLGCAKNLVDTEVMLGLLRQKGFEIIDQPEVADLLIVNTCSFISSAKEESIDTILQMAAYKKTGKCRSLIVAGCLGQRYPEELLAELPEVDAILGTGAWHRINEAVEATLENGRRVVFADADKTLYDETTPRVTTTPFYSAYVKVAEGCDNCCSYCVIPLVRGGFRSRPMDSIVAEVKQLVERGVKEVNLIAQDTTSYGKDNSDEGPQLVALLKRLVLIEGLQWIRLLYCYPSHFSDELIELIAQEDKICKYIDLPLQHSHDGVLRAMNRRDNRASVVALLDKLRKRIPGLALRTTFIVGFPGETEEQFNDLHAFIAEQRFDRVGIFTYSQEEGTVAGDMEEQIAEEVKQERYHQLMALQSKISEELNQALEGGVMDVLIEAVDQEKEETLAMGRSYREAPEVDGMIYVEGAGDAKPGDVVKVRILQGFTYDVVGERLA